MAGGGGGGAGDRGDSGVGEMEWMVMAALKSGEERRDPPLLQAMEVARCLREKGLALPNPELGRVLVSNLCFTNNTPALWKLLDQAMASRLLSPIHTLALLTARVVPSRRAQPEAYRLYLEMLSRYALSSPSVEVGACRDKITKSIDDALQLSHVYQLSQMDFGHAVVLFFLHILTNLIDCTLEDCGLQSLSTDKHHMSYSADGLQAMDVDVKGNLNDERKDQREYLHVTNSIMAIEVMGKVTSNKKTNVFLRLVYLNMPEKFNALLQRLQIIEAHRSTSQILASADNHLDILCKNIKKAVHGEYQLNKHQLLGALVDAAPCSLNSCNVYGAGKDSCWISFDLFLEDAMDGKNLYAIGAAEILTELIKTLQVINQATWQETFQALWISALRLVQRDREPLEGPVPRLDARLCILLSIVPLAIAPILKEEHELQPLINSGFPRITEPGNETNQFSSRRHGLISCLQLLSQYSRLLLPPPSVVSAANTAATKAALFVSNFKNDNGKLIIVGRNESSIKAVGNMLHLIVEACIARNLIDTSAYFWPGYVTQTAIFEELPLAQDSSWTTFLAGAALTGSLKDLLITTPASSLKEVDKLYHIAVNGSDEEKSAAAKILCGASLVRGWNIQEHVVRVVVKLLSFMPTDTSEAKGHLLRHMPVLSAILFGVSCVDIVHILSLHGMVPEIAAALMPLCEALGSLSPNSSQRTNASDKTSVYSVFSFAFLFLLRLWKFHKPPQEHCVAGRGGSVKMELTLDYLLLLRNRQIASPYSSSIDGNKLNKNSVDRLDTAPNQPIYIDSFPKLRSWYSQNQACIASTLSGLSNKNPVHQVANKIMNMIRRKTVKAEHISSNPSSSSSSSMTGSPVTTTEDAFQNSMPPAWEVLEAIPFVLEAVLTACAHGRLSSRDLITGLRDLVDFFPASVAAIITYFLAEITRGIWKPVQMNGTDWPSPAPTLHSVESEVKAILASAGVHIQSCYPCGAPPMLPLPMAALVSLTITFKLDKSVEYIHGVVGHALESCAIGSSWPSMPIIGALWTQKVRRWHDFIVLSCSRSPFSRDKDSVAQLIKSCFSSFFGEFRPEGSQITADRGVSGLLGQALSEQGVRLPTKPGYLYLRTCRSFHDTHFVNGVIFKLVIKWAHKFANGWTSSGSFRLKSSRLSLAASASGVQQVATLGASLLYIAGGLQLVQVLYEETLPTLLLSTREEKQDRLGSVSSFLEGYAMAYMLILSGALAWGIGNTSPTYKSVFSSRRARVIGKHMDFMAGVVGGNILLGCDPATWKAYVLCFIGLLVNFVPAWIPEVKQRTLRKLSSCLRGWHEHDLALSLLERGGPAAMTAVVESVL